MPKDWGHLSCLVITPIHLLPPVQIQPTQVSQTTNYQIHTTPKYKQIETPIMIEKELWCISIQQQNHDIKDITTPGTVYHFQLL